MASCLNAHVWEDEQAWAQTLRPHQEWVYITHPCGNCRECFTAKWKQNPENSYSWVWWNMPIIVRIKRLRQEECPDLETSLGYTDLSHNTWKKGNCHGGLKVDIILTAGWTLDCGSTQNTEWRVSLWERGVRPHEDGEEGSTSGCDCGNRPGSHPFRLSNSPNYSQTRTLFHTSVSQKRKLCYESHWAQALALFRV